MNVAIAKVASGAEDIPAAEKMQSCDVGGADMLWIHIGMPKTGTTALQGFLRVNAPFLADHNIHYMITGRDRGTGNPRLISHNSMAMDMIRGWANAPANQQAAFRTEYDTHRDKHCVLSSEMFFGRDLGLLQKQFFEGLDTPVKVVVYIRRLDDFIEADYKQRVKTGRRVRGGVAGYVAQRIVSLETRPSDMDFALQFAQIEAALPNVEIVPRLYLRDELLGQNVITDFLSLFGVDPVAVALPARASNRSLSRVATEALGLFDESAGIDGKRRRRIGRLLQRSSDPSLYASGDVMTDDERNHVNTIFETRNAALRERYFPQRERLFPPHTPNPDAPQRGQLAELEKFQSATHAILKLIAGGA